MATKKEELKRLTELFRAVGARDPKDWAKSQIDEGIPQLARFLFLKQAWDAIVGDEDSGWIKRYIEQASEDPEAPYAGIGLALKRLLAKGADPQDLIDVVRGMQSELLFSICYIMEDSLAHMPEAAGNIQWGFFQLDEERRPTVQIDGLHESVLETDPTGREMCPRGTA